VFGIQVVQLELLWRGAARGQTVATESWESALTIDADRASRVRFVAICTLRVVLKSELASKIYYVHPVGFTFARSSV
jgi:hypothetical protein